MKTHKFARKPFYVDAIRVSEENIEEVAKWCHGEILVDVPGGKYIKVRVHRPMTDRQTKAFVGDWVLYATTGFKVYTQKAFDKAFERARTFNRSQADAAGISVPHEPSVKPKAPTPAKMSKAVAPVQVFASSEDYEADKLINEVLANNMRDRARY